jgi:hypothetical protein
LVMFLSVISGPPAKKGVRTLCRAFAM